MQKASAISSSVNNSPALPLTRRRFLSGALQAGALLAAPQMIRGAVLGLGGGVAPSERIALGAIGIGNRGCYVLGCFLEEPDVQFVAICDVKATRRQAVKKRADDRIWQPGLRDVSGPARTAGPEGHRRGADCHRPQLARDRVNHGGQAGKDVYCEKPCTKNIAQSLALAETFRRTGRVFSRPAHSGGACRISCSPSIWPGAGNWARCKRCTRIPGGLGLRLSGWQPPEPEPPKEEIDWDLYLGPAAWRPFNKQLLDGFQFRKRRRPGRRRLPGVGLTLCRSVPMGQRRGQTAPVEYERQGTELHARYANGVKLVMRNEGWLPLGSCPVRFEGDTGWVETGDDGELVSSSPALLAGKGAKISGYPANFHVRDFLDCVKTRAQTRANAEAACQSHITCHAANIALFLDRKLNYDPVKNEFIGDEQANRLRSEALRDPWRL